MINDPRLSERLRHDGPVWFKTDESHGLIQFQCDKVTYASTKTQWAEDSMGPWYPVFVEDAK